MLLGQLLLFLALVLALAPALVLAPIIAFMHQGKTHKKRA
jgi:hypothetical protein